MLAVTQFVTQLYLFLYIMKPKIENKHKKLSLEKTVLKM